MVDPRLDISIERLRQRRGNKWSKYGPDVLPVWVADMDFPVAEPIRKAVQGIIDREDFGYPVYGPTDNLMTAFAGRMRDRFDWELNPSNVFMVSEILQAMHACISVYSEPGDGVVVQTPIYPPFLSVVADSGRRLVDNPLVRGPERYEMDLDALKSAIDARTRIVLLCNPHNPTGRAFTRAELLAVAQIALEHDLLVVSDEIHSDLLYGDGKHIPFASLSQQIAERTITLTSATKAFNIAGLRCALMHFGSRPLKKRFKERIHPRMLGVPNVTGIDATIAAWNESQSWLEAVLAQLDANRAHVTEFLAANIPQIEYRTPEATYLAWLDCTALKLEPRPWKHFLTQAQVVLNDGRQFSSYTDQCVRLNFATTPTILSQVLERLADSIQR